jgi:hypothetical protein
MKKSVLIFLVLNSIIYSQNYNMTINLKNGNTVTFSIDDIQRIEFENVTSTEDTEKLQQIVQAFRLKQNYPNPFNPSTTIEYQIPKTAKVNISIFDINGQLVKELLHETQTEGLHRVTWDGTDQHNQPVASGIYIYKVENDNLMLAKQMILLK